MFRIIYLLILIGTIIGGSAAWWGYNSFIRPGPLASDTIIIVNRGSGLGDIANELFSAGVISSPLIFHLGARFSAADRALRAGEYAFHAHISPREALQLLQTGRTVVHMFSVAEGLSTGQILKQLQATDGLVGDITMDGTDAPWLKEGALLPETYQFSFGDDRHNILKRMNEAMGQFLARQWLTRSLDTPLKTPAEALILASIVEKETARAGERAHIAGVFINRLEKGMRLQSDPTVIYGITLGKQPLGRPLNRSDLKKPTAFNTYTISALPPTPISNPGKASIKAVLHPQKTSDLFFVADGTGGHVFTSTLKAHNANVAKWRKLNKKL